MSRILILFIVMIVTVIGILDISYPLKAIQGYVIVDKWGSMGADDGEFNIPHSMAFDNFGNIYVTDTDNNRIQKFSSDGKFITKWGSEGTGDGQFLLPLGIDLDSRNQIFVVDRLASNVQEFSSNGTFSPQRLKAESIGGGNLTILEDIEIDKSDNIYLTDRGNHSIIKYDRMES